MIKLLLAIKKRGVDIDKIYDKDCENNENNSDSDDGSH